MGSFYKATACTDDDDDDHGRVECDLGAGESAKSELRSVAFLNISSTFNKKYLLEGSNVYFKEIPEGNLKLCSSLVNNFPRLGLDRV